MSSIHSTIVRTVRVGALPLGLLLSACAWVPAVPGWLQPGHEVQALVDAEPRELRVAVKLPRPLQPLPDATALTLRFTPRAAEVTERRESLPLVLVNEGRTLRVGGLPSAEPGYLWFLFKLTSAGEAELAVLQSEIRATEAFEQRYRGVELDVDTAVRDARPGQTFSLSVWLQLDAAGDFRALARDRERRFEPKPSG